MTARLGILGGTFNPVHLGHLMMAQDALERFRLDRVVFMPCARPPHKAARDLASDTDRLAMLRLAVRGDPRFAVSDLEIRRGGISYTIETIRALQRRRPGVRWHFIIGSDSLFELHSWREIGELLRRCAFLTLERPGYSPARMTARRLRLPEPWPERLARNVFRGHVMDISSTEVRARAAAGASIRFLVTPAVAGYIRRRKLYR
ncbi:MAG: nicotinate-nucleotide adenylyltransferase [Kiritimatiellae bacterium]|nr:nicotinate-nucleotide adenylyltransferase [Kiritimatiellia bacterium]